MKIQRSFVARESFRVPYPPELDSLLRHCVADRAEGPLLRQRTIADGRRWPKVLVRSTEELEGLFRREMAAARPGTIQAKQDGKQLFRRLLRSMGGVSPDSLAKEFDQVAANATLPTGARFYDLRGSVTTDLKDARVDLLLRKYFTGHSLGAEIMSRYETIKLHADIAAYFQHIQPLLEAITARARFLGLE